MSHVDCPRCAGTTFVRVEHVLDHTLDVGNTFLTRPVGVLPEIDDTTGRRCDEARPIGHFSTSSCEACGHTRWTAHGWHELMSTTKLEFCDSCRTSTEHKQHDAVENVAGGYQRVYLKANWMTASVFENTRVDDKHCGWFRLSICVPCGLTRWRIESLEHASVPSMYERDDACLECRAKDMVSVSATEFEGEVVPVAVKKRRFLGMRFDEGKGRFVLYVCRACRAIEWRADNLEDAKKVKQGVSVQTTDTLSSRGPYR